MIKRELLGKIIQVHNVLDYGDGVSKQIIRLDKMFKNLGFNSKIYAKYFDSRVESNVSPLEECRADAKDVVIFHYSGYSEIYEEYFMGNSTNILLYHNITPHEFFEQGGNLYNLCKDGRDQLNKIIKKFHYFIGDSQYNLDELINLGADKNKSCVWPIIVDEKFSEYRGDLKDKQNFVFTGRFAPNKGQDDLVKIFNEYIQNYSDAKTNLILIGNNEQESGYTKQIAKYIKSNLKDRVTITGKISDDEIDIYYNSAALYISASKHEGFGIPLVEAMYRNIPVIALSNTAVSETLAGSPGLCADKTELLEKIHRVKTDKSFRESMLKFQKKIMERYTLETVQKKVISFLGQILPELESYKKVSIVICTYNRRDYLGRCLDYLNFQTNNNFEVVVVNGPSDDGTDEILEKYKDKIKIVNNPEKNLSVSRNLGIKSSAGDIIAFIDDDAIPFDNWVDRILYFINRVPHGVAGGGGATYYAGSLDFQVQDMAVDNMANGIANIKSKDWTNDKYRYGIGTNCFFKKVELNAIKGFDEEYDYYLDEADVCYRIYNELSKVIAYDNELFLRHEFAMSNNRMGKYNYNWYSICKNTAYFISKANPDIDNVHEVIQQILKKDRINNFKSALKNKEILQADFDIYSNQTWSGYEAGLTASSLPRKLMTDNCVSQKFKCYIKSKNLVAKVLHIVLLTSEFPPFMGNGGVGTLYYSLASELLLMGHKVTVVSKSHQKRKYQRGNFQLIEYTNERRIDFTKGKGLFADKLNWSMTARDIIFDLNQNYCKVDIVDTCLWDSEGLAVCVVKDQLGIKLHTRLVSPLKVVNEINNFGIDPEDFKLMTSAEEYLINNSDVVIPISMSVENTVLKYYDVSLDKRWKHSYIGVAYWPHYDVNVGYDQLEGELAAISRIPDDHTKLLFIGRLEPRKGVDVLLDALEIVFQQNDKISLILSGRDIYNYTQDERFKKYMGKQILYLGELPNIYKDSAIAASDIVLFPSKYESFGLIALEAFIHSKPVIGCNAGAIPEVVVDNEVGLLFEKDNPQDFANKILKLVDDKKLYNLLSQNTKKRAMEFSSRKMAINSVNLYNMSIEC